MQSKASVWGDAPKTSPLLPKAVAICHEHCSYEPGEDFHIEHEVFEMTRQVRALEPATKTPAVKIAYAIYSQANAKFHEWIGEEDFVECFHKCWEHMRIIPGEDLFGSAAFWASVYQVNLRKEHEDEVSRGFKMFIGFCVGLCLALGTSKIKLPCREVAEALDVDKGTVSSYRQRGVELGYLTLLRGHLYSPDSRG